MGRNMVFRKKVDFFTYNCTFKSPYQVDQSSPNFFRWMWEGTL